MNKIMLCGNVGKDPVVTVGNESGKTIAKFNIAVARSRDRQVIDWFSCVAFGQLAEKVIKVFVKQGTKILVEGAMEKSTYTDKEGNERSNWSVIIENIELVGNKGKNEDDKSVNTVEEQTTLQPIQDELPF